jgi:hypothetical protein
MDSKLYRVRFGTGYGSNFSKKFGSDSNFKVPNPTQKIYSSSIPSFPVLFRTYVLIHTCTLKKVSGQNLNNTTFDGFH